MLNINIFANDNKNHKEHSLKVEIYDDFAQFSFSNQLSTIDINTDDLDKLLIDYNQNFPSGQPIQEREIFKRLQLNYKSQIDIDLARIFIISNVHLHFSGIKNYHHPDIYYKFLKDRNNCFLNDFNIIEWDGSLGPYPGIYFIKQNYINEYSEALNKFYSIGWLYKYAIDVNGQEKYENFVFPFSSENIKNYEVIFHRTVWNKVIKDRNEELLKFVNRQRGNK